MAFVVYFWWGSCRWCWWWCYLDLVSFLSTCHQNICGSDEKVRAIPKVMQRLMHVIKQMDSERGYKWRMRSFGAVWLVFDGNSVIVMGCGREMRDRGMAPISLCFVFVPILWRHSRTKACWKSRKEALKTFLFLMANNFQSLSIARYHQFFDCVMWRMAPCMMDFLPPSTWRLS